MSSKGRRKGTHRYFYQKLRISQSLYLVDITIIGVTGEQSV